MRRTVGPCRTGQRYPASRGDRSADAGRSRPSPPADGPDRTGQGLCVPGARRRRLCFRRRTVGGGLRLAAPAAIDRQRRRPAHRGPVRRPVGRPAPSGLDPLGRRRPDLGQSRLAGGGGRGFRRGRHRPQAGVRPRLPGPDRRSVQGRRAPRDVALGAPERPAPGVPHHRPTAGRRRPRSLGAGRHRRGGHPRGAETAYRSPRRDPEPSGRRRGHFQRRQAALVPQHRLRPAVGPGASLAGRRPHPRRNPGPPAPKTPPA